jgi:YhcH/YjgK/YiaL family protein
LHPGDFVVFFPEDAHMPCLMTGNSPQPVKKIVTKLAVELLDKGCRTYVN